MVRWPIHDFHHRPYTAVGIRAQPPRSGYPTLVRSSMIARTAIDVLVQSAAVELFHSLGMAIAPLPPCGSSQNRQQDHRLIGTIAFTAVRSVGTLTLSLAEDIYPLFPNIGNRPVDKQDWLRELTNQLMGRIKNRLLHYQVVLQIGLPSAMNGEVLGRQQRDKAQDILYRFRTLRGEILVTLNTTLDLTKLVYSGAVPVANDNEIILF